MERSESPATQMCNEHMNSFIHMLKEIRMKREKEKKDMRELIDNLRKQIQSLNDSNIKLQEQIKLLSDEKTLNDNLVSQITTLSDENHQLKLQLNEIGSLICEIHGTFDDSSILDLK